MKPAQLSPADLHATYILPGGREIAVTRKPGDELDRKIRFTLSDVEVASAWLKLDADTVTDDDIRSWESDRLRLLEGPGDVRARRAIIHLAAVALRGMHEAERELVLHVIGSAISDDELARRVQRVARQRCADEINAARAQTSSEILEAALSCATKPGGAQQSRRRRSLRSKIPS